MPRASRTWDMERIPSLWSPCNKETLADPNLHKREDFVDDCMKKKVSTCNDEKGDELKKDFLKDEEFDFD